MYIFGKSDLSPIIQEIKFDRFCSRGWMKRGIYEDCERIEDQEDKTFLKILFN